MAEIQFENAVSIRAPRWIHRLLITASIVVVVIAALATIGKQRDVPASEERQASTHLASDR